jgi:hypothetical protein
MKTKIKIDPAKWNKPMEVADVDMAFGGGGKVLADLLPPWEIIPEDFRDDRNDGRKWNRVVSAWFYKGLSKDTSFDVKEGIDPQIAFRHLKTVMGSFDPKHEHKTAGVAWLLSLWFTDIRNYEETK